MTPKSRRVSQLPTAATEPAQPPRAPGQTVAITRDSALELLRRLDQSAGQPLLAGSEGSDEVPPRRNSIEDRFNAAMGCKTSEVALFLLSQIVSLDPTDVATMPDGRVDEMLMKATALVAELQPTSALEALLATQMVGVQHASMTFLRRATSDRQSVEGVDRNVLRVTRLMRLFIEQIEAMAKLKGKSGQQRVVVEHVTVAAGGRAIVGNVTRGREGPSDNDRRWTP